MTSELGKFYGGWYVMGYRYGRVSAAVVGPCKTRAEVETYVGQAAKLVEGVGLSFVDEDTTFGVGIAFAGKLMEGCANGKTWATFQKEPVDIMAFEEPAKFMVRKPSANLWV